MTELERLEFEALQKSHNLLQDSVLSLQEIVISLLEWKLEVMKDLNNLNGRLK